MKIDVSEYCTWFRSEIDNYQRYHHHKETMAWAATAFYLPGIVGLTYATNLITCFPVVPIIGTILIALLSMLAIGFVSMQFKMRAIAADYTSGFRRVLSRLCGANPVLLPQELEVMSEDGFPYFVKRETQPLLDITKNLRTWTGYLGAAKLFFQWKWADIDNRIRTELTSYATIIIVSIIAIAIIWIS